MVTHHIICGTQGGANACGLQIRRYLKHKFADVLQLYPCHERAFRSEEIGGEMRAQKAGEVCSCCLNGAIITGFEVNLGLKFL